MLLELSPAEIRFMHDRINNKFQNGNSVNDTIEKIASGEWSIGCLPRIRVVKMHNRYYAFDNRRLYVYRVLHYRGLLQTVKVQLAPIHQFQPQKFSTKNDGKSITLCRDVTLKHSQTEDSWFTVERDLSLFHIDDDSETSSSDDDDDDVYIPQPKYNYAIENWNTSSFGNSLANTSPSYKQPASCGTSNLSSTLQRPRVQQYSHTYGHNSTQPNAASVGQTRQSSTGLFANDYSSTSSSQKLQQKDLFDLESWEKEFGSGFRDYKSNFGSTCGVVGSRYTEPSHSRVTSTSTSYGQRNRYQSNESSYDFTRRSVEKNEKKSKEDSSCLIL